MKINNISSIKVDQYAKSPTEKKEVVEATANKETPAAVYEKSEPAKTNPVYDKNTVLKLKQDSEKAHAQLIRIVQDMLNRQGKSLDLLDPNKLIEVDETARLEAEKLIGPDGALGVEAVSQRLVDFAIAISGGDKSKADTLRAAIDKGFKEAEKILGELPEISRETYKLTMEKFDAWVNE